MRYFILILSLVVINGQFCNGQKRKRDTMDFYIPLKKLDVSNVLVSDSIFHDNFVDEGGWWFKRTNPLGFIGNGFQRISIKLTSISKDLEIPFVYSITAKTKQNGIIKNLKGKLSIKSAKLLSSKTGYFVSKITLYEDSTSSKNGKINGDLKSNFIIEKDTILRYNALELGGSDNFCNNQFVGEWISYDKQTHLKCNWGDYRIPNSGDLDVGAGHFYPNKKYTKNGWQNFVLILQSEMLLNENEILKRNEALINEENLWGL